MNVSSITETALIDCITMLHTKHQTLGGSITFVEGDLFEVLYGNDIKLGLGQEIGVTIYSPEGLIVFDTRPIATYQKRVMCALPPKFQSMIINRRKEVRVPVRNSQCLITGLQSGRSYMPLVELQSPIPCMVENISINGIRILLDTPFLLKVQDQVMIDVAGIAVKAKVQNIQKIMDSASAYLGLEFVYERNEQRNAIRSFLVQHQIANRPEQIQFDLAQQRAERGNAS